MTRNILLIIFLLSLFFSPSSAQVGGHVFKKTHYLQRVPVPYSPLNQRDVMWSKRAWRIMDLKEKINHPFYYPIVSYGNKHSLFNLIRNSIQSSELTVYDAITDEFTLQLTKTKALSIGTTEEDLIIEDEDGVEKSITIYNELESHQVMRFRIKEEWFFDKQRSVMDVRIIGLCPVIEVHDSNGDYKGEQPMYWVYFPEVRPILARQESVNNWNEAEQRSYDDLFAKRFFSSYVYKVSNVYDRKIGDYKTGIDALLESKAISKQIFDFEQDLWEY